MTSQVATHRRLRALELVRDTGNCPTAVMPQMMYPFRWELPIASGAATDNPKLDHPPINRGRGNTNNLTDLAQTPSFFHVQLP